MEVWEPDFHAQFIRQVQIIWILVFFFLVCTIEEVCNIQSKCVSKQWVAGIWPRNTVDEYVLSAVNWVWESASCTRTKDIECLLLCVYR